MDIDLVLSGGSVQGLCVHAGFLQAIEGRVEVKRMATCSAGTLVGALWATGRSADEVWALVRDIDFRRYLSLNWWGTLQFMRRGYVSDGLAYRALLDELFGTQLAIGTDIEMRIAVSNLSDGKLESWGWDRPNFPLADTVYASSCIPGAFKELEIHGKLFGDGGVYAHFPTQLLHEHSERLMVGHRFDNLQVAESEMTGLDKLWLTLDRLTDANADASQETANLACVELHQPSAIYTTRGIPPGADRFDLSAWDRDKLRERGHLAGLLAVRDLA